MLWVKLNCSCGEHLQLNVLIVKCNDKILASLESCIFMAAAFQDFVKNVKYFINSLSSTSNKCVEKRKVILQSYLGRFHGSAGCFMSTEKLRHFISNSAGMHRLMMQKGNFLLDENLWLQFNDVRALFCAICEMMKGNRV